jgi:hypothetical protein
LGKLTASKAVPVDAGKRESFSLSKRAHWLSAPRTRRL